jgi:hypothetical protein
MQLKYRDQQTVPTYIIWWRHQRSGQNKSPVRSAVFEPPGRGRLDGDAMPDDPYWRTFNRPFGEAVASPDETPPVMRLFRGGTTHSLLACQIRQAGMNQKGKISVLARGRAFGWRKEEPPVDLDHRHCQEIIMEIGDRLRAVLRRESTIVSPRLEQLLEALRDQERTQRSG